MDTVHKEKCHISKTIVFQNFVEMMVAMTETDKMPSAAAISRFPISTYCNVAVIGSVLLRVDQSL